MGEDGDRGRARDRILSRLHGARHRAPSYDPEIMTPVKSRIGSLRDRATQAPHCSFSSSGCWLHAHVHFIFFFKDLFIYSFRERQRHRQREKQAPCRKPDVGLDPGSPGSHPGLQVALNRCCHGGHLSCPHRWMFCALMAALPK